MALQYSPKIVTDRMIMCLDASQNTSLPTYDLPVKNGLLLWLDAADDTTFSYNSGTIISQWRDKSGNNNHASNSTVGQQPSRSTVNNSKKSVFFNASTRLDYMTIASGISLPSDASIFIVYKPSSQVYQYAVLIDNYHGLGGNNGFVIQRVSTNSQFYYANAGDGAGFIDTSASPWTYTDNVIQLLSLNKSTTVATPYISGTAQTARSVRGATSQYTTGLAIGFWGYGGGRFYNGDMCEILIYNRSLTDAEFKKVHTYLGIKWGILNTDRSIIDISGNNNHGLLGNGTTSQMPDVDYYNKQTLSFTQTSNDTVMTPIPITSTPALSNFTYEVWTKLNKFPTAVSPPNGYGVSYRVGFLMGASAYAGAGLLWYGYNTGDALSIYAFIRGNDAYRNTNGYPFALNQYYHCVMVHNYGANKLQLYINGTLYHEVAGATQEYNASNIASAGNIGISKAQVDGGGTANYSYYDGIVPIARIYNKALSATEVLQNYNAQKSRFDNTIVQQGLVLNLDAGNPYSYAGAGTTWYDTSGAINDFTIVNAPTYSSGEFLLNGSTQYFSISTGSGFFISSTNNFYADVGYAWSISVWFKFPVSPTNVRDGSNNGGNCSYCLFGNSGGIGGAETLALFVSGISGTTAAFHPYYCVVGLRGSKTQLSANQVNTNTWNYVVVTWNGSAGRGYFNGVDIGALNIGANTMQVSGYTIGTTVGGNQGSHTFEGSISQVSVYNRAISASEVLQNYNATKGRFGL